MVRTWNRTMTPEEMASALADATDLARDGAHIVDLWSTVRKEAHNIRHRMRSWQERIPLILGALPPSAAVAIGAMLAQIESDIEAAAARCVLPFDAPSGEDSETEMIDLGDDSRIAD